MNVYSLLASSSGVGQKSDLLFKDLNFLPVASGKEEIKRLVVTGEEEGCTGGGRGTSLEET